MQSSAFTVLKPKNYKLFNDDSKYKKKVLFISWNYNQFFFCLVTKQQTVFILHPQKLKYITIIKNRVLYKEEEKQNYMLGPST